MAHYGGDDNKSGSKEKMNKRNNRSETYHKNKDKKKKDSDYYRPMDSY